MSTLTNAQVRCLQIHANLRPLADPPTKPVLTDAVWNILREREYHITRIAELEAQVRSQASEIEQLNISIKSLIHD